MEKIQTMNGLLKDIFNSPKNFISICNCWLCLYCYFLSLLSFLYACGVIC